VNSQNVKRCCDIVGSVRERESVCVSVCLYTRAHDLRTHSTHTHTLSLSLSLSLSHTHTHTHTSDLTFADDYPWQDDCADEPSLFTQYFSSEKKDDKQE
jgi:hypothetical protein